MKNSVFLRPWHRLPSVARWSIQCSSPTRSEKLQSVSLPRRVISSGLMTLTLALAPFSTSTYVAPAEAQEAPATEEKKIKSLTPRDKAAESLALNFIGLVDAGKVDKTWEYTASVVRNRLARSAWEENIAATRKVFGSNLKRKYLAHRHFDRLPEAPDGDYLIVVYRSAFERKADCAESVTLARESNGKWRVAGYFVR